ncbi:MAG TPA: hypothetical protein VNI20_10945 [Fimbriimonadaceae bacterium]|nr:hypothetical protein [Fimbriimonadaceae bacterium]
MNVVWIDEEHSETQDFLADVHAMCALIGEAGRYGTTATMEQQYRVLRSRLTSAYRALSEQAQRALEGVGGFHGCGFEMILGNYSLDNLARGPGAKCVDRLNEVWRRIDALHASAP